jgi:signal transduction histidine kinase/ActR/RegA family two-component response regulator
MTQAGFMIDREQFSTLFPFHFLLDANMRVLQTGAVLARICPQFREGQEINDHFSLFDLSRERAQRITPELISRRKAGIFILKSASSDLSLRLQAMILRDPERYLFLGSPWVRELKEMRLLQLVLNDFALHDSTIDLIQITQTNDITKRDLATSITNLEHSVAIRTAELSLANAELSRVMRSKDDFLSAMSHELRTPLNAILGLSESLAEGVYGDMNTKQVKSINTIAESGHHLLSLINDLLDIAKIGAGKMELELSKVNVEDVCQASLRFVMEQAQKQKINLKLVMDNQSVMLTADERRLKQILVNLLSNSVKFTPDGGSVSLETKCDLESESLMFSVRDTGIGIAPDDLKRLFSPFTQLDSKLSRQYSGTGLGLTLVMKLVELHGGSVAVESEIGKGSCFTIRIPCKGLDTLNQHNPSDTISLSEITTAETLRSNTPLILVADDNEINLITVTDYLRANNLRVIQARDGLEAVKMVREHIPSLVLMDIQMPLMDGLDAIAHLRADDQHSKLPIIALTSRAMVGDRERCIAVGANDYLSKPVNMKQLVKTIHNHLPKDETR